MINVQVVDHISPTLNGLANSASTMLQELIEEESQTLTPYVQQNAPVGTYYDLDGTMRRGGQLKDSLRFVIGQWGSYLMGAQQGVFVAGGTKPHTIEPKVASRLAFFWGKVNKAVYPQKVNHPGTKKNDFRQNALQQASDEMAIQDTAVRILSEWVTSSGA